MKQLALLITAGCLALTLSACSNEKKVEVNKPGTTATQPMTAPNTTPNNTPAQ